MYVELHDRSVTVSKSAESAVGPREGVGGRLRQIRTARRFSVRELARLAGCSASLLSQVERGVTKPSAEIVYALANQLGVSLDYLFGTDEVVTADLPPMTSAPGGPSASQFPVRPVGAPAPAGGGSWGRAVGPGGAGIVQRAGERNTIELSTGVRWERLTPTHDSRVDFLEVVYEPGGQSSEDGRAVRHDGREYLRVLDGELEAVIGFDTLVLAQGDSLSFDPTTPHLYRNRTDAVVRVISVVIHDLAI